MHPVLFFDYNPGGRKIPLIEQVAPEENGESSSHNAL
ncbi:hypothetical protein BSG1_17164 [Bacillus sp. SG-1]|nr:hypothetical protein BSG1_17164 [Bacillus sp. SG-1]